MLDLLVLSLATWRLSSLLVVERGPFDIFMRLRSLAGIQHDQKGDAYMIPDNIVAQILSCVWCCSTWIAIFLTTLYVILPEMIVAAFPFALSAIAIIIQTAVRKDV